jgi:hypothetical protein
MGGLVRAYHHRDDVSPSSIDRYLRIETKILMGDRCGSAVLIRTSLSLICCTRSSAWDESETWNAVATNLDRLTSVVTCVAWPIVVNPVAAVATEVLS